MPVKHAESYPQTPEALSEYNESVIQNICWSKPVRAMRAARRTKRREHWAILAGRWKGLRR